jgi:hypothetical protein
MSRPFHLFLAAGLLATSVGRSEHIDPTTAIASWTFEDPKDIKGVWESKPGVSVPGPTNPAYPHFSVTNKAMQFNGKGMENALVVKDNGTDGPGSLRLQHGESLTLEAWVKPGNPAGQEIYLIGKGRSHKPAFGTTNQNYALRVKRGANGLQVGFIFSSHDGTGGDRKFHVWWSDDNQQQQTSSWHHVAVTYTFGKGDSLKGYIDGSPVEGVWSFAGVTDRAPVTDADDLVIGTGMTRGPSQTLNGALDNVAIHRTALSPEIIRKRYAFIPPPPAVTREEVPAGKVLIQVCEKGVPNDRSWPESTPVPELTYTEDAFGLFEIPQKYIASGVRADRYPALVRAAAVIDIPAGKHRLLLRSRGGSRLFIEGRQILTTPFARGDTGGHGKTSDQDNYLNLGPDFRFAPPGNRENWTEFESKGGKQLVLMETIIGVGSQRPELGETVVAISPQGSQHWQLLSPGSTVFPYTDAGWAEYEKERRPLIVEMNRNERAKLRATQKDYWERRKKVATDWLASTKEVPVPALPAGHAANNPIDNFVAARITKVASEYKTMPEGGVDYFRDIRPILETKCYDCHRGSKVKGDLRLDNLADTLAGGSDDGAGITPGKPKESSIYHRIITDDEDLIMPPKGDPLTKEEIALIEKWIAQGANWPEFQVKSFEPTPLTDDLDFLRRVTLDTTGVVPTENEIQSFLADQSPDKRAKVIDKLLADPRWADHWTSYWQDVLAENPNIINPTLNNTGPFRWWIHESLVDNKPMDLFVTELVRLEGSDRYGGPRGFGTATQNDSPMAEKGAVVAAAFLGVEMKCARCHDAPAHEWLQKDLFNLAALLNQGSVKVPATSSVPMDKLHEGGRKPLIKVTLKPGTEVQPEWPFKDFVDPSLADELAADPANTRDRFAALITAPQNERFAKVIVNRLWQRLMGRGIVESVADWEKAGPTHPELLNWLGREFVRSNHDFKAIARLILNSQAYQRATDPTLTAPGPLYVAPAPRRMTAEQIVDSLFAATGKPFDLEEVSLDLDSNRSVTNSITLGVPTRSWMLASTSNERDRPSLSLPKIQAVSTVLEAFGWRGARQDPVSIRDNAPNTLQPAIISNGTMGHWLTTLSDDHGLTTLALEDQAPDQLVDRIYLRLLTRKPTAEEKKTALDLLGPGYEKRILAAKPRTATGERHRPYYFTWSNHLDGKANELAVIEEEKVRRGKPATEHLQQDWRERLEDLTWTLLNTPEWIFVP